MSRIEKILQAHARRSTRSPQHLAYDIVFVLNVNSRGWILEKICAVIAKYSGLHCKIVFSERNDNITSPLPTARAYFFGHYALAFFAMLKNPIVFTARRYFWFAHFDNQKGVGFDELVAMINVCNAVFVPNSAHKQLLVQFGARSDKIEFVLGGANPDDFRPKPRGAGKVGFVGACYERKNPDLILEVIRANPDVGFFLLGPHPDEVVNKNLLWGAWNRFDELRSLPNLEYVTALYGDFPTHFAKIDTLISLSTLEGGPIPLIEALMTNALVIATDTGFARDVIDHQNNGWLLPLEPTVAQVHEAIAWARSNLENNVSEVARASLSWETFGEQIAERMFRSVSTEKIQFTEEGDGELMAQGGWARPDRTGMATIGRFAYLTVAPQSDADFIARRFFIWRADGKNEYGPIRIGISPDEVRRYTLRSGAPQILSHVSQAPRNLKSYQYLAVETAFFNPETSGRGVKLGWMENVALRGLKSGDSVMFNKDQDWVFCLEDNWHSPETNGVWSRGPRARIAIPLAPALQMGGFSLQISGRVIGATRLDRTQVDIATLDRRRLASKKLSDSTEHDIKIEVPVFETETPILIVTLSCSRYPKPIETNPKSSDQRSLGFFLRSAAVTSAKAQRKTQRFSKSA